MALKDKLIVPVEVPAWGVVSLIVSGAFGFGVLYKDVQILVKNQDKIEIMYERQIKNIDAVQRHERVLENHETRIRELERAK